MRDTGASEESGLSGSSYNRNNLRSRTSRTGTVPRTLPSRIALSTRSQEGRVDGVMFKSPSRRTRYALGRCRDSKAVTIMGEDLNLFVI